MQFTTLYHFGFYTMSVPLLHQTTRKKVKRWTVGQSHFLSCAEGPSCETEAFPERTLVMSKKITTTTPPTENNNKEQGWHANTDLGCDVKTILRSDMRMKVGKEYPGVFRLDSEAEIDEFLCRDPHYTFTETVPLTAGKRNPHVFVGRFVTITRREDGSLRPNLKQMPKLGTTLSVDNYAFEVYRELRHGLKGLVEESEC